jgi:hypothetical protein
VWIVPRIFRMFRAHSASSKGPHTFKRAWRRSRMTQALKAQWTEWLTSEAPESHAVETARLALNMVLDRRQGILPEAFCQLLRDACDALFDARVFAFRKKPADAPHVVQNGVAAVTQRREAFLAGLVAFAQTVASDAPPLSGVTLDLLARVAAGVTQQSAPDVQVVMA